MTRRPDALPWSKFWWKDYDRDPALRRCSLPAQGLWMRLLCIMAEAEPYGFLMTGGTVPSHKDVARMVGAGLTERATAKLMAELAERGVYSVDERGVPYCRRMVREVEQRAKAKEYGSLGGNPVLRAAPENGQDSPKKSSENNENIGSGSSSESRKNKDLGDFGVNPSDKARDKRQEARGQRNREGLRPSTDGGLFDGVDPKPNGTKPPKSKAEPKPDPNRALKDSCADKLAGLTGKPAGSFHSLLNGWIRDTGGDAQAVQRFVDDAVAQGLAAPVPAIVSRVQRYSKHADSPVPDIAGGVIVREIVAKCEDITEVTWSGIEGHADFDRVIAGALAAGADPDKHIYPVMRRVARMDWRGIKSSGFFRHAIWELMRREAA